MTVRTESSARGPRIVVPLGGEDHVLSVERATRLRDALTRELGAPQVLTDREAMVWATEFVRAMAEGRPLASEIQTATSVTGLLRGSFVSASVYEKLDDAALAMLAAMTGGAR